MAVTDLLSKTPLSAWAVLFILALVIYFTRIRFRSVLRTIPGPFIASFTNWWRLYDVSRGLHQETLVRLHREYASDLVRVGPNVVSVADPEAMKLIYGLNKGFSKVSYDAP